jgi:hypothetical protein
MKTIALYLSRSSIKWVSGTFFILVILSSCSTGKEASFAYRDDIYKPYSEKLYGYNKYADKVADQDASIIKPYRQTVSGYTPTEKSLGINVSFGYGFYHSGFGMGYGRSCYGYGYGYGYRYGYYPPFWFNYPFGCGGYYGGYTNSIRYRYYDDYASPPGDSYLYRNNISYFYGVNSVDKKSSYAINYAKYSNYRAIGEESNTSGRKSRSAGKNRYQEGYNGNKSKTKSSSGSFFNTGSHQGTSGGSSTGSGTSPSRSSGSGGSGSYSGKRPR